MPRNIETKRRCPDLAVVRSRSLAMGSFAQGKLVQADTYFAVSEGKLKLRQIEGAAQAELIRYERESTGIARASDYTIERIAAREAESLIARLAAQHGVRCVVRKVRELLLWRNVRIHLDTVDRLGTFVELESVVSEKTDEPTARLNFDECFATLHLGAMQEELKSYGDLLTPSPPAHR